MDLVLFGIQGSGKGTQAKRLAEEFGYEIFEMGGQLRSMAASRSDLGKTIASYIDHGNLVPHAIVMEVLHDVLAAKTPEKPMLFDGVPRDFDQMRDFDAIMDGVGRPFRAVHLVVPEDVVLDRLRKRAEEQGRADDAQPEVIRRRIDTFREKTIPVISAYANKGLVMEVDGLGSVDEVYDRIREAVGAIA